MNKYKKKYKSSKRGKFVERLWRRLKQWRKVYGCKTNVDLDKFIDHYCDVAACEHCGEKGAKLFFHLNDKGADPITINNIDLICRKCLIDTYTKRC